MAAPTGFAQAYDFAHDVTLLKRVTMAALVNAQGIAVEPTATANHTNRAALMKAVTNNPDAYGLLFAIYLLANNMTVDPATVTDAAITTAVGNAWNALAGVA